jgi:2-dehydropantoate 2-reductase
MPGTRIIIAGIGGVGGYFGGLLARHYAQSDEVEICFIARGDHLTAIRNQGLRIMKGESEFTAKPALATDRPEEAGRADFIFVSTKDFDLESMIQKLRPCIDANTIILPLLNGVNSRERIQRILPDLLVGDGCVYIVSRLKAPGVVENSGNIQTMYFGVDGKHETRFAVLEELCRTAGIEATYSQRISKVIWEKYIFISAVATVTSFYHKTVGEVLSDTTNRFYLMSLIDEVMAVAIARDIAVSPDIAVQTMKKVSALTPGATSSLHSDFIAKKTRNELEALTGYVVRSGTTFQIATPAYEEAYRVLQERSALWS